MKRLERFLAGLTNFAIELMLACVLVVGLAAGLVASVLHERCPCAVTVDAQADAHSAPRVNP